ncbi:hypothetical protein SSX86_026473 [Deinandra increscens subsp. villosa]|uniref:Uncharacterized protein n=1 Tax=Deinandra increscens subsp. villosa TaxID=3103831 RepID=A0AAP0CF07_9ASTR
MEQLCGKWWSYRLVETWCIWRFVEGKGTPATGAAAAATALVNNGIIGEQQTECKVGCPPQIWDDDVLIKPTDVGQIIMVREAGDPALILLWMPWSTTMVLSPPMRDAISGVQPWSYPHQREMLEGEVKVLQGA